MVVVADLPVLLVHQSSRFDVERHSRRRTRKKYHITSEYVRIRQHVRKLSLCKTTVLMVFKILFLALLLK
jgi:hypothetical protein